MNRSSFDFIPHLLVGVRENCDEVLGLMSVSLCEESVGQTFIATATRPSDTMDVTLCLVGKVVVDDTLQHGNVWGEVEMV